MKLKKVMSNTINFKQQKFYMCIYDVYSGSYIGNIFVSHSNNNLFLLLTPCPVGPTMHAYLPPMVRNYYESMTLCVFGAPTVPFDNPIDVLAFTSEEKAYVNDTEGISLILPKGALPDGVKLNVEVGSARLGPFSFPEGVSPVSPILWICPQQNIPLRKPMKITLLHMMLYDEETKIFFMKADHRELYDCLTTESSHEFSMKTITHDIIIKVNFDKHKALFILRGFATIALYMINNLVLIT